MLKIQRLRTQAFHAQHGRCCYCGLPMWQTSPEELNPLGLRGRTAMQLRCTAEHLLAQQDGGGTEAGNIAAACWLCNNRRHKRKEAPEPSRYRQLVQKRMARGKWHAPSLILWNQRNAPS